MKSVTRLLVLLAMSTCGLAQAALPADFAYGLVVDYKGRVPLLQVEVPEALYTGVMLPGAQDIMVFNAKGEALPYTMHAAEAFLEPERRELELPFYPVWEDDKDEAFKSFRVIRDESGAVANIIPNPATDTASRKLKSYLVVLPEKDKAAAQQGRLIRLHFDWQSRDTGFTALVSVEQSDDLVHWRTLVNSAALARVINNNALLEQRDITLAGGDGRYLRVNWPSELANTVPETIVGEFEWPPLAAAERSHPVAAQVVDTQQGKVFEFDSQGRRPVSSVKLAFAGQNVVLKGTLKSRNSSDAQWVTRYQGSFYEKAVQDAQGNDATDNRRVAIDNASDRYWRFEPEAGQVLGGVAPQLVIGWRPQTLVFLQRGNGPYTIAYGRYALNESNGRSNNLYADLGVPREGKDTIDTAAELQQVVLGGEAMLVAPPPPLPWKRWLLWAALGLGMLLLLYMVRQLVRQMSRPA